MRSGTCFLVLTGAGAAIPFGGPSTQRLTEIIAKDPQFRALNGHEPLGQYLLSNMEEQLASEACHFEALIEVVEDLYNYFYDLETNDPGSRQLVTTSVFDPMEWLRHGVMDFGANYRLEGGKWYHTQDDCLATKKGQDARMQFCINVYQHWLNTIISKVRSYAQSASEHELAPQYQDFLGDLDGCGTVRHYTLNYDRMAAEIAPYDVFDGFGKRGDGGKDETRRVADPQRVRLDGDSNCAYNLHGSIFYDEDTPPEYSGQPESASRVLEWICTPHSVNYVEGINIGRSSSSTGERRLWSNIVTGLSKPERILLEPQRAFYQRFAMDCAIADTFIVAGYSFGDPHINSLVEDRIVRGGANLWYVDKNDEIASKHRRGETHRLRLRQHMETQNAWLSDNFPSPRHSEYEGNISLRDGWAMSSEETYALYAGGFDTFLQDRAWTQLL